MNALWALFQWDALLIARSGGEAFCALGGGDACATVSDSRFASAVHRWTLIPVAGWGVVWSLVAIVLPLLARLQMGRGRPTAPYWSATLLTAAAGVASVPVLAAASLASGVICTNCVGTYLLVLGYGATCWRDLEQPLGQGLGRGLRRGLGLAGAATLAAFLLLLYPGVRTPRAVGGSFLASIPPLELPPQGPDRDRLLASFLQGLRKVERQSLSDALEIYERGGTRPLRPPRSLIGPADAPVRITEFSDILCSHCATLHSMLTALRAKLPPDSFSIESRHFPLDAACNPHVHSKGATPLRCTAAKALICAEGEPYALDYGNALFRRQRTLTEEAVYALAEPHVSREKLAACIVDPATEAKLREDIAWAVECGLRGTPLVLVNGRAVPAFPPFLYAILLAGGDPNHPIFARLPQAPRREPHPR